MALISPELASLRAVVVRLGDRCPAHVRWWLAHAEAAPPERARTIVCAASMREPALAGLVADPHRALDPTLPPEIAAALVLGEPVGEGLTRAERAAWLADLRRPVPHKGSSDPAIWLVDRALIGSEAHEDVAASLSGRIYIARWLVEAWADPPRRAALLRERVGVVAGQRVEGRYIDRVDELVRRDLRPSVEDTFARAGARLAKKLEKALASKGEPLAPEPRWWKPIRCARLLRTGPDLVAEGRAMRHCVATYAVAVRERQSTIVGICVLGQRSTVEIRDGRVAQHRGYGNGSPPELCERALKVCLRRWKLEGA